MEFTAFFDVHPIDAPASREVAIPERLQIDADLRSFLSVSNITSFSNGFLRTLNSDELLALFSVWRWAGTSTFIFMRTAFGGLFCKNKSSYYFFDPTSNDLVNLTNDLNFVLNIALCDRQTLDNAFFFNLYKRGSKLKGVPQEDECFAFVPALKLGGKKSVENLEIVKLKEHLYLLSQI